MTDRVLVVKHVPWEGPHRIGDALIDAGFELDVRCTLDGDALPARGDVAAAVFMGGPMNVDETERFPGLLHERHWLAEAARHDLPILGVCLGAQLLARALGAGVTPGAEPEIGWGPIAIHDDSDLLARHLAPDSTVLHWHGDAFGLPPGAALLASSAQTAVQGFRSQNAWGLLFHAEADLDLARTWMAEPSMRDEAEAVLGTVNAGRILVDAAELDARIRRQTAPLFRDFAALIESTQTVLG
ncbi:MAG: type 1 glutamine amidotransferase [Thermoleophilaceae bacterium]|nr:type 1 glutamine amidotransferase [Thermoleophilaceae bacterium]